MHRGIIGLAIALLLIGGIAGYFLGSQKLHVQEPLISDTTNWQTYRNYEMGFEIKLPPDWDAHPGEEIGIRVQHSGEGGLPLIDIYTSIKTPEEFFQEYQRNNYAVRVSHTTFAGENAWRVVATHNTQGGYFEDFYIPRRGGTWVISTLGETSDILSTFRFTN